MVPLMKDMIFLLSLSLFAICLSLVCFLKMDKKTTKFSLENLSDKNKICFGSLSQLGNTSAGTSLNNSFNNSFQIVQDPTAINNGLFHFGINNSVAPKVQRGEKRMFPDGNVRLLEYKYSGTNLFFESKNPEVFDIQDEDVSCKWKISKTLNSYELELLEYMSVENDVSFKIDVKINPPKTISESETIFLQNIFKEDLPKSWPLSLVPFFNSFTFEIVFGIYIQHKSHNQLSKKLANLFNDSKNSDVTFIVGNTKFHAHRVILADESFRAIDISNKSEKFEKKIENVEPDIFKLFLQYFYTGKIKITNGEQCLPLVSLAHQYCPLNRRLALICAKNLAQNLNATNVLQAYALFHKNSFQKEELQYKLCAEKYILENTKLIGLGALKQFSESDPMPAAEILFKIISGSGQIKNMLKNDTTN